MYRILILAFTMALICHIFHVPVYPILDVPALPILDVPVFSIFDVPALPILEVPVLPTFDVLVQGRLGQRRVRRASSPTLYSVRPFLRYKVDQVRRLRVLGSLFKPRSSTPLGLGAHSHDAMVAAS